MYVRKRRKNKMKVNTGKCKYKNVITINMKNGKESQMKIL